MRNYLFSVSFDSNCWKNENNSARDETFHKLTHRPKANNQSRMRNFVLLQYFFWLPLLSAGQIDNDKVLLVEHNNAKRQYFYVQGNEIIFFTRQGETARGFLSKLTDSTINVSNKTYYLKDIAKIKRKTATIYSKVIGSFFIVNGGIILASAAADPDLAGPLVITGLFVTAIGVPLVTEPSYKVGVNCRLRVASRASYINRR